MKIDKELIDNQNLTTNTTMANNTNVFVPVSIGQNLNSTTNTGISSNLGSKKDVRRNSTDLGKDSKKADDYDDYGEDEFFKGELKDGDSIDEIITNERHDDKKQSTKSQVKVSPCNYITKHNYYIKTYY